MHGLPLYCYWQYFNCDYVHITWRRQTNNGKGDGEGVRYTINNDTPHFNQISDEEKDCGIVGTTHAVSYTKTMSNGTVSETLDALQKGRSCVFATNNHCWWNLGTWLWTQIEILESSLEGKKFTEATKILIPSFKGEANDDNGLLLYRCNCHIQRAIWLYSGLACVCTLPLQNFEA